MSSYKAEAPMTPINVAGRVLVCIVIIVAACLLWRLVQSFIYDEEQQLSMVRSHVAAMFQTDDSTVRRRNAEEAIEIAKPLLKNRGVIGTTATLYVIGTSPVTRNDVPELTLPSDELIQDVATADLISVVNLFLKTKSFGLADDVVSSLLKREADESRVPILKLASELKVELGRDADVLMHCEEAIELAPNEAWPYRIIASVHRTHSRWDNYISAEAKAVELTQGTDLASFVGLIDGYVHLGRTADARREFNKLAESHPEMILQVPTMYARLLMQEGKNEKAEAILKEYLQVDSTDTEALVLLGTIQVSKSDFQTAIDTLQKVLAISQADEQAYYQLGQAYARIGETEKGKAALDKHRMLLDEKVRLFALEQQAAREPLNAAVRRELAQAYEKIGIPELADFWNRSADALQ